MSVCVRVYDGASCGTLGTQKVVPNESSLVSLFLHRLGTGKQSLDPNLRAPGEDNWGLTKKKKSKGYKLLKVGGGIWGQGGRAGPSMLRTWAGGWGRKANQH